MFYAVRLNKSLGMILKNFDNFEWAQLVLGKILNLLW